MEEFEEKRREEKRREEKRREEKRREEMNKDNENGLYFFAILLIFWFLFIKNLFIKKI